MTRCTYVAPRLVAFSIVLSTTLAAVAAESILLKPTAGALNDSYSEYTTDVKQKMTGPDGKPMGVDARSTYGLLLKAAAEPPGEQLTGTFDRLFGSMLFKMGEGEGMKSTYDTDDPENENASPDYKAAFTPIVGMPVTITLNEQGEATKVEGADQMRQRLIALGEGNFIAKSIADDDLSDRQVMSHFGETPFVLYPYGEVKVGETWRKTRKDKYPQVGKIIVNYECTLQGIKDSPAGKIAEVMFFGTIAKDPDDQPEKDKRLGTITGNFTGIALFSSKEGRFTQIERQTTMKIGLQPWWNQDLTAPLMQIEAEQKNVFVTAPLSERQARKSMIEKSVADMRAKRKAEEAAAMAGEVDPVTPENSPKPWLQWGGPNRDFSSEATGLANRWPKDGPSKLWERQLGDGYSAILCDGDTLYTMYSVRDKEDPDKGDEIAVALDAKTGKTLWEHKYPAPFAKEMEMEFGPGPHSTPILVGDRLFTVGTTAQLHCLDKKTGQPIWSKDLLNEYKANLHSRGYGASPIAYDNNVVLTINSEKGNAVMAFAQADGKVAWKGGEFEPGYSSMVLIDAFGKPELVAFGGKSLLGLDPSNASTIWSVDHPTQWGANIATPLWSPQDNQFFISSAYGMGARGVQLERSNGGVTAREIWFNDKMKVQHASVARVGDWVYGSSGDFGPAFLCCINAKTGEFGWRQRGISKANVVAADGKLIVLDEDGTLYLVKADPKQYRLFAKAEGICEKTAWTVPTLYGRTLFVRDRKKIMALDLGAKGSS